MRLVTFLVGPKQESECYVTILPSDAGGVAANLNRWRNQMGQPVLDDAAIAALPRAKMLETDVAVMEAAGDFVDMQQKQHAGYLLLAVVCPQKDRTVFVKMVGPEAEVRAERERFAAFLGSLK
jgi:hypothetical protein